MNILYTDQIVKQEQYQDLLREAEHYRLVKTTARPRPKRLQKIAAALRKAVIGPTRDSSGLKLVEWQARS